jgi:hypothetical protein
MLKIFQYYSQYQGAKGRLMGLPLAARAALVVLALPGLLLAALSLVALVVSLLALLVMTLPVYRLFTSLLGRADNQRQVYVGEEVELIEPAVAPASSAPAPPTDSPASGQARRPIEVRIID